MPPDFWRNLMITGFYIKTLAFFDFERSANGFSIQNLHLEGRGGGREVVRVVDSSIIIFFLTVY